MLALCWVTTLSALQNAAPSANRIVTTGWPRCSSQSGRAHPSEVVRANPHRTEARSAQPRLQLLRSDAVVGVVLVEGGATLAVDAVGRHERRPGRQHAGQLGEHTILGLGGR